MTASERQRPGMSPRRATARPLGAALKREIAAVQRDDVGMPKLRVLFVTEDDPLYVIRFFDVFLAEYPREELEICGITIDRAFHESIWKTLGRMHGLYGPWGLVRQGLRFADARLRDRSIASLARSAGVAILPTKSVNDLEYIKKVRTLVPDVIVSVAAPEIFRSQILDVPRLGCINIHSGRLPTYRGMLPTFWQMLRGERVITMTVHRMVSKLDAGDVLATEGFSIRTHDSLDRVIKGTKREGARLVMRVLRDLRAGRARPTPLDMAEASYFSFPKPENVKEFRGRGHRLL